MQCNSSRKNKKVRKNSQGIGEGFSDFFHFEQGFFVVENLKIKNYHLRKMKVTIEFCECGFAKNSICIYTTIGTSGYPKGENLLWHTILRHAKSSVLYLCSVGGEKDVCRFI